MNREIGEVFGISHSAVSKADKDIERIMGENGKVRREIEKLNSHFKG